MLRHGVSPYPAGRGAGLRPAPPLRGGGRAALRVSRPLLRVHRVASCRQIDRAPRPAARSSLTSATVPACARCRRPERRHDHGLHGRSTGCVMGTRCGAIDPGVLLYLMERTAWSAGAREAPLRGVGASRRLGNLERHARAARELRSAGRRGRGSLRLPHRARARLAWPRRSAASTPSSSPAASARTPPRSASASAGTRSGWASSSTRRRTPRAAPASAPRTAAWRHGSIPTDEELMIARHTRRMQSTANREPC